MSARDERAKTGVPGLDEVLGGGLPRDRVYLIHGDPGAGKTTLGLQFLMTGRAAGERCLYVSLSETRVELEATARSHGVSLEGIGIYELTALDQSTALERENTLFESSEVELQETTRQLLEHIDQFKPQRIVVDSLSELRLLAQSSLRYRRQILGLKQHLTDKHCTLLFLDDRGAEPGDAQLQTLAHGVLQLEHSAPSYGEDRRRLRVMKLRGVKYCGGYHDFAIRHGGIRVFPRLIVSAHPTSMLKPAASSGVPQIDQLLAGGLDRGTSTLITGPAGCGKSVLATQFALAAAARGEKAAVFAFEEGTATFFERCRGLGMPVDSYVESGLLHVQQIDPAEMGPGEFARLAYDVIADGARLVIIDSLNGYLNAMTEAQYLAVQLHELLAVFAQRGVTTILIMAQYGLLGNMRVPVDVSYLSDTVLLLRYFEVGGRIRKAISVVKKRCGPHEDTIRELSISPQGLLVGEPLTQFSGVLTGVPRFFGNSEKLSETA
jgi:circadian clock protein KaiC